MPALPILQMSGRRYAHHLGALTSPLMTSMRTPVIPSESRYFGCPPSKINNAYLQSIDFMGFLPTQC